MTKTGGYRDLRTALWFAPRPCIWRCIWGCSGVCGEASFFLAYGISLRDSCATGIPVGNFALLTVPRRINCL
jgi:hypothetical protein